MTPPSGKPALIICNRAASLDVRCLPFPGEWHSWEGRARVRLATPVQDSACPAGIGCVLVADQTASEGPACSPLVPGTSRSLGLTPVPPPQPTSAGAVSGSTRSWGQASECLLCDHLRGCGSLSPQPQLPGSRVFQASTGGQCRGRPPALLLEPPLLVWPRCLQE